MSARRGGCATTFDDINRYFTINCMPVVSSQYWNQVHGNTPEDVRKDEEGLANHAHACAQHGLAAQVH